MPDNEQQVKSISDNLEKPKRTKQPVVVPVDAGYQAYIDYITERGLSLEQATSNGLTPAFNTDPRALGIGTVKHHWEATNKLLPGMLVDYGDESYSFRYICADEDLPTDKDGKLIKMPSPYGSGSRLFFPKCIDWDTLPAGTRVRICESALKAVCCSVRGEPSIGLNGVSGWSKGHKINPQLADLFKTRGLVPVITFDANAHEGPAFNPGVSQTQSALVSALYNVCEVDSVYVTRIPYSSIYDQGVDDYLANGNVLEALVTYKMDADGTEAVDISTLEDFFTKQFAPAEAIVEGYISRGESNLLTASPKCGKTRIALTAALQIAAGKGDMLGIPGLACHKSKVMVFILEDGGHQLQNTLRTFMDELEVTNEDVKGQLVIVQDLAEKSDILIKINSVMKSGFKPDLIIVDNITRLAIIEQKQDRSGESLIVREYRKIKRFSTWAQENNIAMILLSHSKKGAGSATNISDKTNSTGTMAGAVDNLSALDRFPEAKHMGKDQRRLTIQARHHGEVDVVLNIGEGAVTYVGDMWDFNITDAESKIILAMKRLSETRKPKNGDELIWITTKEIADDLGANYRTIKSQGQGLVNKGWIDSRLGVDGGYTFTKRGAEAVRSKF